jgi:hypothetical protein
MANKEVLFIRHGESLYNEWAQHAVRNPCLLCCLCGCDPKIYDASLSDVGEAQVVALRSELLTMGHATEVQLVVTSPLARAIETTLGAFFPASSYLTAGLAGECVGGRDGGHDGEGISDQDSPESTDQLLALESPPLPPLTTALYGAAPICCALHREALDTAGDVGKCKADLQHKYGARIDTSELLDEVWWSVSSSRHYGRGLAWRLGKMGAQALLPCNPQVGQCATLVAPSAAVRVLVIGHSLTPPCYILFPWRCLLVDWKV